MCSWSRTSLVSSSLVSKLGRRGSSGSTRWPPNSSRKKIRGPQWSWNARMISGTQPFPCPAQSLAVVSDYEMEDFVCYYWLAVMHCLSPLLGYGTAFHCLLQVLCLSSRSSITSELFTSNILCLTVSDWPYIFWFWPCVSVYILSSFMYATVYVWCYYSSFKNAPFSRHFQRNLGSWFLSSFVITSAKEDM